MTPEEYQEFLESDEMQEFAKEQARLAKDPIFQKQWARRIQHFGHVATTQKPPVPTHSANDFAFPGESPNHPDVLARQLAYKNAITRGLVKVFQGGKSARR